MTRTSPNIIITGTPGVGKTSHCEILAQNVSLKHLVVNDIVKERGCDDGWDEERKTLIVDEDKVSAKIDDLSSQIYSVVVKLIKVSYSMRLRLRCSREAALWTGMHAICSRRAG